MIPLLRSQLIKFYFFLRFWRKKITVGSNSWISRKSIIEAGQGGSIQIGHSCEIHSFAMMSSYGGSITMGNNCSINPFCVLYGHGGLKIGNGVRIATHTAIIPANHIPGDDETPLYLRDVTARGIEIGDYTWLGAGCRVLDGVTIGKHVIVGAGSVVTKSIPDYATVAGVPAKVINIRNNNGNASSEA